MSRADPVHVMLQPTAALHRNRSQKEGISDMLELVDVGSRTLESYRGIAPDHILEELSKEAEWLRGARVLHVNATAIWRWRF